MATSSRAANDASRPKCYVLEMFPYPSGRIHMGHVRNYAMGDVFARYKRARGFNVLHPMGWDAFGMPAENAAIERKTASGEVDLRQHRRHEEAAQVDGALARLEPRDRDLQPGLLPRTSRRLFLDLLAKGLAYRKSSKVNWDPVDHTVLANEQVIDGRGWRSGALVEQRELTQWFFKITAVFGGAARSARHARQVAREGAPDAGQLDRPLGRHAGALGARQEERAQGAYGARDLYDAAGHAVRRFVHGYRAGSSAGEGRCRKQSGLGRVRGRMPAPGHVGCRSRVGGEEGLRHRHPRRSIPSTRTGWCRSMSRTSF